MIDRANGLAIGLILALAATAAAAAPASQPKSDPHAKHGNAYGDAFARLPNWTGAWQFTAGDFLFDPDSTVNGHDKFAGIDFGTPGGAYMSSPPYKTEWKAEYDRRVREAAAGRATDAGADCRPDGVPRILGGTPLPIEIIVLPKVVFMTWSYMNQTRRIYTDGRTHPPRDLAYERELGHSIGHWEGDQLVVDTIDLRAGSFDASDAPHSAELHLTERWKLRDDGGLQVDMTIVDPVVFTRPWKVTRRFYRTPVERKVATTPGPDWPDVESVFCTNNRNGLIDGAQSAVLPGDKAAGAR